MAGALAIGGLFGLARPATASTCTQNGSTVTCVFSNPNAAENWVVPAGVLSARITAQGGSGGRGFTPPSNLSADGGVGGAGGTATAIVSLSPGAGLRIYVGGNGGDGPPGDVGCEDNSLGG